MTTNEQLRQERSAAWERAKRLIDDATADGRQNLSSAEKDEYDRLERQIDELTQEIEARTTVGNPIASGGFNRSRNGAGDILTRDQSVADWAGRKGLTASDEYEGFSFAKALRGAWTGNWRGCELEQRVMSEGTNTLGGFTVPTALSSDVIDLARNETRVFQAGARTIPMTSEVTQMPRIASHPSSDWRAENAAITADDMEFERIEFRARSLDVVVRASWELIEDSAVEVEAELRKVFAREFAVKLDHTALYGSGTAPEPRGVFNFEGVTKKSHSSTTTNTLGTEGVGTGNTPTKWDIFVDAVGYLDDANRNATGMILAPRTERTIATKFLDENKQPLQVPDMLKSIPRFKTNQVPTDQTLNASTDCSDLFVADWSDLLIGVRTEMMIIPLKERYAENGQVAFIAHFRGDVQLAHDDSFVVVTGLRP